MDERRERHKRKPGGVGRSTGPAIRRPKYFQYGVFIKNTPHNGETLGKKSGITLIINPHESKLIYVAPDGNSPKGMNLGGKQ